MSETPAQVFGERRARHLAYVAAAFPFLLLAIPATIVALRDGGVLSEPLVMAAGLLMQIVPALMFVGFSVLFRFLFHPADRRGIEIAIGVILLAAVLVVYARVYLEPVFGPMPVDQNHPDDHKQAGWAFLVGPLLLAILVTGLTAVGVFVAIIRMALRRFSKERAKALFCSRDFH